MTLTKNTEILRAEVAAHIKADALVRGSYWKPSKNAVGGQGCFISCLTHSSDPTPASTQFGLPVAVLRIAENIFEALPDHGGGQTDHYDAEDGPHVCGYEPDGHGVFIVHAMRPAAAAPCSTYAPFTVLFMLPDYLRSGQSCAADMLTRAFTKAVDAGTAPDAALTHLMSAGLIDPDDADDYAPVAVYEGHISDRLTP